MALESSSTDNINQLPNQKIVDEADHLPPNVNIFKAERPNRRFFGRQLLMLLAVVINHSSPRNIGPFCFDDIAVKPYVSINAGEKGWIYYQTEYLGNGGGNWDTYISTPIGIAGYYNAKEVTGNVSGRCDFYPIGN